jgi:hypothetical protein
METSFRSGFAYARQLAGAGREAARSALDEVERPFFSPPFQEVAWLPVAAGATIGLLGIRCTKNAKKTSNLVIGAAIGSTIGLGAAVAWATRHVTKAAARKVARRINEVRDSHWLELNPIDYA